MPLICCPENDFDITVKLADIFSLNDVASVTIVTMDKPCCAELKDMVLRAVKQSRLPIPVQITNLFVDARRKWTDDADTGRSLPRLGIRQGCRIRRLAQGMG